MDANDYLLGSDILGSPASSAQARYDAAVKYTATEIAAALGRGTANVVDLYAAQLKTAPFRSDLERITDRWSTVADDSARDIIARDAELLADRVQEILPGASQSRTRTNLTNRAGIVATTPGGKGYTEQPVAQAETDFWGAIKEQGKGLKPEWKWPWWGTALIIGGAVVGGLVILTPVIMPLLVARSSRTQIVLQGSGGRGRRR